MLKIFLTLFMLIGSYLLLGALVRFSENLIRPATAAADAPAGGAADPPGRRVPA